MSALPQRRLEAVASPVSVTSRSHSSPPRTRLAGSPQRSVPARALVHSFPTVRTRPVWWHWGQRLHRGSTLLAGGLVLSVMGLYGWTVYTQQQWSQAYSRLEEIQRHEQQMTAAIAGLKGQIAQQAESSGLVPLSPANAIVVTPAQQRDPAIAPLAQEAIPLPLARLSPLGY